MEDGATLEETRTQTKEEALEQHQQELDEIVDAHDDSVRLLFQLDRFVTLVDYDPAIAKQDKSDVFTTFQHTYDLQRLVQPEARSSRRGVTQRKSSASFNTPDIKGKRKQDDSTPAAGYRYAGPSGGSRSNGASSRPSFEPVASTSAAPFDPDSLPALPDLASLLSPSCLPPLPNPDDYYVIPPEPKRFKPGHDYVNDFPYTHPDQVPPPPLFNHSLPAFLSSYRDLSDDAEAIVWLDEDARAEHEAGVYNEYAELVKSGREIPNPDQTMSRQPVRARDHRDHLIEQGLHFAKLVNDERKSHALIARKISRMVLNHFAAIKSKEDKLVKDSERGRKTMAKWTAKEVAKKWKLAVNLVRTRRKESQQLEQDRLGKLQLNAMLDKSTTMLQAQQTEMKGEQSEEDDASTEEESEEEEEGGVLLEAEEAEEMEMAVPLPTRTKRSVRSRASASLDPSSVNVESLEDEGREDFDEDADDARLKEDEDFENEMEEGEGEIAVEGEDEMDGLAADAEMSIEELMRRSGYGDVLLAQAEREAVGEQSDGEEDDDMSIDEDLPASGSPVPSSSPPPVVVKSGKKGKAKSAPKSKAKEKSKAKGEGKEKAKADPEAEEEEVLSEFDEEDKVMEAEDEQFDEAMDENEGGSDDSEMDGLAEEAEMTVEELRKRYYGGEEADVNGIDVAEEEEREGSNVDSENPVESEGEIDVEEVVEAADDSTVAVVPDKVHLRPPFLLRGSLRPYQQAGLEWLAGLYSTGVNGILADEMGLGKTIQTISLLAHLACDRGQWGPHLVVVPTSVMLNWEMEFKKFLPGFKILTYYGTQKERKEKRKGWNTENAFHVCVTSYQLVLADANIFRRKPWQYLILDEAHHIKNFRSLRWQTLLGFNARHRLLLTGTPLQNNLMELWSLLYFLMPAGMSEEGGKGPFADHSDFQAWFSNPMERAIEAGEVMDDETKATVAKLHTVLRPYLLRRLKSEVEKQMPGKTESIIYCRLSKRQRFLYDDFMNRSQTRETLGSGQFLNIINCLMQLRKVCNHPDLFEVRPILTSFAMRVSIADDYEIKELLVRKRLLAEEPAGKMDWSSLKIIQPTNESDFTFAAMERVRLDAGESLRESGGKSSSHVPDYDTLTIAGWKRYHTWSETQATISRLDRMATINSLRCISSVPYFGSELLHTLRTPSREHTMFPSQVVPDHKAFFDTSTLLPNLVKSNELRAKEMDDIVSRFAFVTPKVKVAELSRHALAGYTFPEIQAIEEVASVEILQKASTKLSIAFPDRSLLQYDCGKLQKLAELLRECKAGGHRVLIFTQMTKVLDILEIFLSFHGHRYLRLDGSTKIEQRQIITERFNSNDKILCFISSTRSGGLGINLQGADTVIFYDSDWNPALDRQCQDRAHRIGQTREVRIWRFVTEHSIEENMLKKANQKRRLDEMVIAEGDFTTDYLAKLDWRDYLDDTQLKDLGVDGEAGATAGGAGGKESANEIRNALAAAEDEEDAVAGKAAEGELQMDGDEFSESNLAQAAAGNVSAVGGIVSGATSHIGGSATPSSAVADAVPVEVEVEEEGEADVLAGTIDGFMVRFVDENLELFD